MVMDDPAFDFNNDAQLNYFLLQGKIVTQVEFQDKIKYAQTEGDSMKGHRASKIS